MQHDQNERQPTDDADRAVLGAGNKSVDEFDQLGLHLNGDRGLLGPEGGGGEDIAPGRAGGGPAAGLDLFVLIKLGRDELDQAVERVDCEIGVLLVQDEACYEHGDGHQRAESKQGAETEGGGATGGLGFLQPRDRDGDDAQAGVAPAAQGFLAEVDGLPNLLLENRNE